MSRALQIPQALRQQIYERDMHTCRRCYRVGLPLQIHHRCPRRMGGSSDPRINDPRNLVSLCTSCHDWIESHRDLARDQGWLLRDLDHLEAMVTPVAGGPRSLSARWRAYRSPRI